MKLIDYDMQQFAEAVLSFRGENGTAFQECSSDDESYFSVDEDVQTSHCVEYGFDSPLELREVLSSALSKEHYGGVGREELIRACLAACYKYDSKASDADGGGAISEFIYEF